MCYKINNRVLLLLNYSTVADATDKGDVNEQSELVLILSHRCYIDKVKKYYCLSS